MGARTARTLRTVALRTRSRRARTAIAVGTRRAGSLSAGRRHLRSCLDALGHVPAAEFSRVVLVARRAAGAMRLALHAAWSGWTGTAIAVWTRAAVAERTVALRPRAARRERSIACCPRRRAVDPVSEIVVARRAGRLASKRLAAAWRTGAGWPIRTHRAAERLAAGTLVAAGLAAARTGAGTAAAARFFFPDVIEAAQFARFFVDVAIQVRVLRTILADPDFHRA